MMETHPRSSLIFLICVALLGCTKETSADETKAVRACFDGYKQAILDQDGKTAVTFVDKNTISFYGKMLDLALRGKRETVEALPMMDKLMVLSIRHRAPSETVRQMTPSTLFEYAVDKGWIGKQSVTTTEMGDITVSGTKAIGVHLSGGKQTPVQWTFHKEDERWGMDLTSIMPLVAQALKQVVKQKGVSETRFILSLLESVSGEKVTDTTWEPMIK